MKNNIIITLTAMCLAFSATAQTAAELFDPKAETTWLGIDYSQAKYYGDPGTVGKGEMVTGFNAINNLVLSEPEKFNISKFFKKNKLNIDLQAIIEANEATDQDEIITYSSGDVIRFTPDSIRKFVEYLHFPERLSGTGILFIAETLDKTSEQESFWVTFVNIKTKEVLLTERVMGKAAGFGFRNHWSI